MSLVVFLRAVNVGGHKSFKPSVLAKKLVDLDVVNIGAAGTFVVCQKIGQVEFRNVLRRHLPVETEVMICKGSDLIELARRQDFDDEPEGDDIRRFVTILAKPPRMAPALPFRKPAGGDWQVKVFALRGKFALSHWRRQEGTLVYPNEVVEKLFGVSGTTRNWNTISAICAVLNKDENIASIRKPIK